MLALLLDLIYPFHSGLLYKLHPVHTSYVLARRLCPPYSGLARGVLTWFAVVSLHLGVFGSILYFSSLLNTYIALAISVVIVKFSISLKLLIDVARRVEEMFVAGRGFEARVWAQQLVRRDVFRLDDARVVSSTLESLSESLVDGFASPLLYYALAGPLGALLQRVANSLDSALGYRSAEYINAGRFSALMDTVLNAVPSRLTALLIVLLSPIIGGDLASSYRVWRRYHSATESFNAGHPISAFAGALGVRLEKPGHYVVNEDARPPTPSDIVRGVRLISVVSLVYIFILILFIIIASSLSL